MNPFLPMFIVLSMIAGIGCKTPAASDDQPPTERQVEQTAEDPGSEPAPSPEPGPFEVAEEWLDSREPSDDAVDSVSDDWDDAWIERMHRQTDGYRALVLGGDDPGEGILLTVRESDGGWEVTSVEVVPADYLWPTK